MMVMLTLATALSINWDPKADMGMGTVRDTGRTMAAQGQLGGILNSLCNTLARELRKIDRMDCINAEMIGKRTGDSRSRLARVGEDD